MPSKRVCELQLVTETSINNHDLIVYNSSLRFPAILTGG